MLENPRYRRSGTPPRLSAHRARAAALQALIRAYRDPPAPLAVHARHPPNYYMDEHAETGQKIQKNAAKTKTLGTSSSNIITIS